MNNKIESGSTLNSEKIKNDGIPSFIGKFTALIPFFAWRLGLGPITGRYVMIITYIDHKTGNPNKTSLDFYQINGIKYVANTFGIQSKWYRNLLADPKVTIQTYDGSEQMVAVPVTQDDELITVIEWFLNNKPLFITQHLRELGIETNRKDLLKHKKELLFIRFDPTSEPTPRGLEVDLAWIWPILLFWSMTMKRRKKK
jgi:deazaflavin-dependent oxidoreductase (nitroreductase family)